MIISIEHLRFQSNDIADKLGLVPLVVAHLPSPIQELDALHPLVHRELILSGKVVYMLYK
jgi:hypothetical protein